MKHEDLTIKIWMNKKNKAKELGVYLPFAETHLFLRKSFS